MTNKEILTIYKKAEKHWRRPEWLCKILDWNYIQYGLCWYFRRTYSIKVHGYLPYLEDLWIKHKTTSQGSVYDFNNRKERLEAIRKVIKDLEKVYEHTNII
jgi:hypothetical protein